MGVLFAAASLPPLSFNQTPPISVKSFYEMLELNLSSKHRNTIDSLRRIIDVKNILSFQTGVLFDKKGNFLESGLRLALTNSEYFPDYMLNFLEKYPEESDLLQNFPKLYAMFFFEEIAKGGMAAEFLTFEKNLNLVLFGYNGKRRGVDVLSYLVNEDASDPLVTYIAMQAKNTSGFIFPYKYKPLEKSILDAGADPMKQYFSITKYRFSYYQHILNCNNVSFKGICAYMMCLWILDELSSFCEEKGREVLKELVESEYE
jgi:hypothetical protein